MYYLKIISLNGCPYSEASEKFVNENKIKSKIFKINHQEKDKFKTEEISTFPQIFLKKEYSSGNILIGGFSTIKSYFDDIHSNKKTLKSVVEKIKRDNSKLSEKSVLRLIQLLS
tara:strand:+ start:211 stop:552 length:342 start_codon:yes stop_codon:yes gene_type:complete